MNGMEKTRNKKKQKEEQQIVCCPDRVVVSVYPKTHSERCMARGGGCEPTAAVPTRMFTAGITLSRTLTNGCAHVTC